LREAAKGAQKANSQEDKGTKKKLTQKGPSGLSPVRSDGSCDGWVGGWA
jgi:hypothetical protein